MSSENTIRCDVTGEVLGVKGQLKAVLIRKCVKCRKNDVTIDYSNMLQAMCEYHGTLTDEQIQGLLSMGYRHSHNELCEACQNYSNNHHTDYGRLEYIRRAVSAGIPENSVFSEPKFENNLIHRIRQYQNDSLYIWGDNRIGKSRAVCAVAAEIAQAVPVYYRNFEDFVSEYLKIYQEDKHGSEDNWITNITRNFDLVILDDIGQNKISPGVSRNVYKICDKVKDNGYRLWLVSNLMVPELEPLFPPDGASGISICERIEENCRIWKQSAADFRIVPHKYKPTTKDTKEHEG